MLAESIEGADTAILATSAFWDEKTVFYRASVLWAQWHCILRTPRLEACIVDVRGQQVDAWCTLVPEVDEMCQWPCRRIFARTAPTTVHRSIHIERHIMDLSGCQGQMLHIAGIAQCHKLLVGILIGAVMLCPALLFICLFCQRRMVACRL